MIHRELSRQKLTFIGLYIIIVLKCIPEVMQNSPFNWLLWGKIEPSHLDFKGSHPFNSANWS